MLRKFLPIFGRITAFTSATRQLREVYQSDADSADCFDASASAEAVDETLDELQGLPEQQARERMLEEYIEHLYTEERFEQFA